MMYTNCITFKVPPFGLPTVSDLIPLNSLTDVVSTTIKNTGMGTLKFTHESVADNPALQGFCPEGFALTITDAPCEEGADPDVTVHICKSSRERVDGIVKTLAGLLPDTTIELAHHNSLDACIDVIAVRGDRAVYRLHRDRNWRFSSRGADQGSFAPEWSARVGSGAPNWLRF